MKTWFGLYTIGEFLSWQTVHARVGGVQPLNLEANWQMVLFGVSNFRLFEAARHIMPETVKTFTLQGS